MNLDFNNKIFNKECSSYEKLEKAWLLYQELKKDVDVVNDKSDNL